MTAYDWPGNIRELRNVVERELILARAGDLDFATAFDGRRKELAPVEEADGVASEKEPPVTDVLSFTSRYRWIVGHPMAKAGMEGAYWDGVARLRGVSVSSLWGGTRKAVLTGTSVGLEPTVEALMDKVDRAVRGLGVEGLHPCMALSFLSLSVIPRLKLTDRGYVDLEGGGLLGFFED